MKFNIKNRWTGSVIFTAEIEATEDTPLSMKLGLAVKVAVKSRANLADAYLARAYLAGADLAGANLADADLARADLEGADLAGAYLEGADLAGANLAGANLADADLARAYLAGAYLAGANLAGAYIAGAYLAGANLADILETVPLIPNIDAAILTAIEKNKAAGTNGLEMGSWHGQDCDETNWCNTTHCRAGYAICLAGKEGFALEAKYGPANAGMLLYLKSTPNNPIPDWGTTNKRAMDDLRERAKQQGYAP